MSIKGMDNMTTAELNYELNKGGKFVRYEYCVSIIVMTFKRSSNVYFIKSEENPFLKGLIYTLISLIFGWWGFPWGPIYTIGSIFTNSFGGRDITEEIVQSIYIGDSTSIS